MGASYAAVADVRAWGPNGSGLTAAQASDNDVNTYLEIASRVIDDYTGAQYGFGGQVTDTVTVSDVRTPLVPLPRPFAGVTQVWANGMKFGPVASSTVQGSPTPTTTAFNVATGAGSQFSVNRATQIGTVQGVILTVIGDAITLASPLASAPSAGASVIQFPWIIEDWGLRLYIPGFLDVDGFPRRASTPIGYGWRAGSPYGSQVLVTATFGYASVPTPVKQACILVTNFLLQNRGEQLYDGRIQRIAVEGYQVQYKPRDSGDQLQTTGVIEADRLLERYRESAILVG